MDPYGSDAVMSHEIHQGSSLDGERRDEDTPSYVPLQSESLKFDKSPSLFLQANVVSSLRKNIWHLDQFTVHHVVVHTKFRLELDHTEIISNARRIYLGTSKQLKWGMAFSKVWSDI